MHQCSGTWLDQLSSPSANLSKCRDSPVPSELRQTFRNTRASFVRQFSTANRVQSSQCNATSFPFFQSQLWNFPNCHQIYVCSLKRHNRRSRLTGSKLFAEKKKCKKKVKKNESRKETKEKKFSLQIFNSYSLIFIKMIGIWTMRILFHLSDIHQKTDEYKINLLKQTDIYKRSSR